MFDPGSQGALVAERYLLERRVSVQAWGSLWLGRDQNTRRLCAIRLGDVATHEQAELAVRYHGELEAATQFRCENVIDIFDQGDWNGIPYLVMERLEGEILAERLLRQRPLDPWTTYRIVAHVACALSRAHGVGVVHRDLDPEHIILVPAGKHEIAKVFDFGVTRQQNEWAVDRSTKVGSQQGLPYYASPERAGGVSLDWRSDLWSLAIIVYECLTGRRPFESESLGDLLARILHQPIPEISCPTLDPCPALAHWWERAVTRERTERFQTAKDLADELGTAMRLPVIRVPALRPMFREDYAPSPPIDPAGDSVAAARVPVRQTTRIGLGDSVAPPTTESHDLEAAALDQEAEAAARDQELGAGGDYEVVARPMVDWRWVGVAAAAFVVLACVYLGLGWVRRSRVMAGSPTGEVGSASASAATSPVAAPGSSALTGTPGTTAAPEPHAALPGAAEPAAVPPAQPDEARSRTPDEPAATSKPEARRTASRAVAPPAPTGATPTRRPSPASPTTPPRASPASPATTPPTAPTPREQTAPPNAATFPPAPAPAPARTRDYGI